MSLELLMSATVDEEAATAFLRQNNCLRRDPPLCKHCLCSMTLVKCGRGTRVWRCPKHRGEKMSIRNGSIFERSSIPLAKSVQLMYLWAHKLPIRTMSEMTGIDASSCGHWSQCFREVCSHWLLAEPNLLGGPKVDVEVEAYVYEWSTGRKQWILGGICPTTGGTFLCFIEDKTEGAILPVIVNHIVPGSVIHTDRSECFSRVSSCSPDNQDYEHIPDGKTNHIKVLWKNAKKRMDLMCGVHHSRLESYLDEFVWREMHGTTATHALFNLMLHTSQWYKFNY